MNTQNTTANNPNDSVAEAAKRYAEAGFAVLPAPRGEKEARIKGWPQLIVGVDAIGEYFPPEEDLNIVRVNGTNSGGRGDIDLDRPEAVKVANYIVSEDVLRFGREGQQPGHIEVRFADETVPRTTKYLLPGDGDDRMVVELRADGSQTLLPPSVYPNGDRCVWQEGEVLEGHAVTIRGIAEDIAVSALLLLHYPGEGARHEFWLGAIGMLIKARHPAERVRRIVEATARSINDPEWRSRLNIIDKTVTRFMIGERVAGKAKLAKASSAEVPQILKEWLHIGAITDSGLPHVVVNNRPLREVSDEATDALVAANDPPEIFARSGNLARLAQDSEGRPVIQDVDSDRLRYRMTRTAEYLKVGADVEHVFPPATVVSDVLSAKAFSFPELMGITQSPALRPSGTVLDKPGYDAETKLIYVPTEDIEIKVPVRPSTADVEAAVEILRELYTDFPFVDESSLANMLALTITPVVRPAYSGPTPLAVIDKPAMGTGASLLSEVVCKIATAQPAAMMSPPDNDEETRKQITAVLRSGRPIIVVDNLGSELKNASWSRVLTSTTWEDRILGHSRVATLPQRATWIATGNNVKIGGDLPRRCYWIRMDAKLEKPWDRDPSAFTHPDLLEWVSDSRGEILGALLTLARNWFASGKPRWTGRPPGSFEGWARLVGGILQSSGVPGFLGNADKMFDSVVDGIGEWESFLAAWREVYGSTPTRVKTLVGDLDTNDDLRDALPMDLAIAYAEDGGLVGRRFGDALSQREGVRHGAEGLRVERCGKDKKNKVHLWRVVSNKDLGSDDNRRGQRGQRGQSTPTPENFGKKQHKDTPVLQSDTKYKTNSEQRLCDPADPADPAKTSERFAEAAGSQKVVPIGRSFTLVEDEEDLARLLTAVGPVNGQGLLGVDLETTGLRWWEDKIRVVSISTPEKTVVVDVAKVGEAIGTLYRLLETTHLVFHNAVFDIPFLIRAGCTPTKVSCTKVLSRLRWAGRDDVKHSLVDVVKRHAPTFEVKTEEVDHDVWKHTQDLPEAALEYAASDTKPLLAVYEDELGVLEHIGMAQVAELEEKFLNVVVEATSTGMPVEPSRWGDVVDEATSRKRELAEILDKFVADFEVPDKFTKANTGRDDIARINWSSPEQKIWAVETLGISVPTRWDYKKKVERKTLDKNHLHLLDHPIAEALSEYQAIANFPATYTRAIEEKFYDGWMYPDWQQLQARTGRMSCQNPPMHNMPKKSKLREAIVAPGEHQLVALDFSQIEPRVLAALSKDRALLAAFREDKDVYRFVASKVTGAPGEEVSKALRGTFKTIVLGLIYGMSEYGLALRIHRDVDSSIPKEQIVAYRDGFFDAFPEATKWREGLEAEFAEGSTETRTILNRRRMNVENPRQRWNAPIQGTACDAFKAAAVALYERRAEVGGGFKIVALIHDEVVLLVEGNFERSKEVEKWAKGVMSTAAAVVVNAKLPKKLAIPIEVDGGSGSTLQAAKDSA